MKCPFCGAVIDRLTTRSFDDLPTKTQLEARLSNIRADVDHQACPSCGKVFYMRKNPKTKATFLMSREDALSIDALRLANMYLGRFSDPFTAMIAKQQIEGANIAESVWAILDEAYADARERSDWNIASKLLLGKSRYLCSMGEDFFPVQQEAMRCQLRYLQQQGASRVRIMAGHDGMVCRRCAEQGGRVLAIDTALREMPLPVACDVESRKAKPEHDHGWCRCFYVRAS
jgi:hypothetical protein